jgi:hypothetical protein
MKIKSLLIFTILIFGIYFSYLSINGVGQIGIQSDENLHLNRLANYIEFGWYLPTVFLQDGIPKMTLDYGRINSYGPVFSLLQHVLNIAIGLETWGNPSNSSMAYEMRHYATVFISIVAGIALASAFLFSTRSLLIAVSFFAILQSLPLWSSYSMFAIKDIPVAAGYTIFTAGLIINWFCKSRPAYFYASILIIIGVILSVGTRTAIWLPLALTILMSITLIILFQKDKLPLHSAFIIASFFTGILFVLLVNGNYWSSPFNFFFSSVSYSSNFEAWKGLTLTDGKLLPAKPGPSYLPLWIFGSTPIMIALLSLLGIIYTFLIAFKFLFKTPSCVGTKEASLGMIIPGILLSSQFLGLPAAGIVLDSVMYAGMRQHLYVLPAIAGLAVIGSFWNTSSKQMLASGILVIICLTFTARQTLPLHPYQFIYKNAFAQPVNDKWETDMHWISAREAVRSIPKDSVLYCYKNPLVGRDGNILLPKITDCHNDRQLKPFLKEKGLLSKNALDDQKTTDDSLHNIYVLARKYRGAPYADGCRPYNNIVRKLGSEEVVISYVLICDHKILKR